MRIYVGGTFDLFHYGHLMLLRRCAQLGEVVVGLNTDEFVEAYKGDAPIIPFEERRAIVRDCRYVTEVLTNLDGADSRKAIQQSGASVVAVGMDWLRKDYLKQLGVTVDWLQDHGYSLLYLPYTQKTSTTKIINAIRNMPQGGRERACG